MKVGAVSMPGARRSAYCGGRWQAVKSGRGARRIGLAGSLVAVTAEHRGNRRMSAAKPLGRRKMSIDDRASRKDSQGDDAGIQDLSAKKVDEQESEQVKGGIVYSDIKIIKTWEKSST